MGEHCIEECRGWCILSVAMTEGVSSLMDPFAQTASFTALPSGPPSSSLPFTTQHFFSFTPQAILMLVRAFEFVNSES